MFGLEFGKNLFKLNEKQTILKNLIAFDVPFLLIFSSSNCISSIQAVLYPNDGLGIVSQVSKSYLQVTLIR